MTVIQEAFSVPDDIAIGLATGNYERFGGVIRWAVGNQRGQIVQHLDPISNIRTESTVGRSPKTGIVVGILLAATVGGVISYLSYKKHKKKKKIPKSLQYIYRSCPKWYCNYKHY